MKEYNEFLNQIDFLIKKIEAVREREKMTLTKKTAFISEYFEKITDIQLNKIKPLKKDDNYGKS